VEVTNRFKGFDTIEYLMNNGQRFVTLYRRQGEKGTTEDEMVGWHHELNGHEFE